MSQRAVLVYDEGYLAYDFGAGHAFRSYRLAATIDLMEAAGLLAPADRRPPRPCTDEELAAFHDPEYIAAVQEVEVHWVPLTGGRRWGLEGPDNPPFPAMHRSAALIAGGTLLAAQLVMAGEATHAFNPGGGLHHAHRRRASGFCVYNDIAVAIAHLRRAGVRVAYVDLDAHHGDGVQWAFYEAPDVLTVSLHESGQFLFPGTGDVTEIGEGPGAGYSVNVPLWPHTGDDSWLTCFRAVVPTVLRAFQPDLIITQHGCDAHRADPLSHLALSLRAYQEATELLHQLAHELCQGRWVAVGGGGYAHLEVVPRAWSAVWAIQAGRPLPAEVPAAWRARWAAQASAPLPQHFTDPDLPAPLQAQEAAEHNRFAAEAVLRLALPYLQAGLPRRP